MNTWAYWDTPLRDAYIAYQCGRDPDGARIQPEQRDLAARVIAYACDGLTDGDARAQRAYHLRTDAYLAMAWTDAYARERREEDAKQIYEAGYTAGRADERAAKQGPWYIALWFLLLGVAACLLDRLTR